MGANRNCSICSAPAAVRSAIDEAITAGEPLRAIEGRSAFSRAALSRHGRRCLPRDTVALHRNRGKLQARRIITSWPDGSYYVYLEYDSHGCPLNPESRRPLVPISPSEVRPTDLILVVKYAAPPQPVVAPRRMPDAEAETAAQGPICP